MTTIAIIGAGMAGAACAAALIRQGEQVVLFDKGRRPGGRAWRRALLLARRALATTAGGRFFLTALVLALVFTTAATAACRGSLAMPAITQARGLRLCKLPDSEMPAQNTQSAKTARPTRPRSISLRRVKTWRGANSRG